MSAPEFSTPFHTASRLREEFGFNVIPLRPRGKQPAVGFQWKPYQTEFASDEEVEAWDEQYPGANWGVVCGKVSGIVVADLDGPNAKNWAAAHLPPTPFVVKTGRGEHWYYRYPEGKADWLRGINIRAMGVDIDVQRDGKYVVCAGSVHETGAVYTLTPGGPLEDMPEFFVSDVPGVPVPLSAMPQVDMTSVPADFTLVKKGGRHNALTAYAGGLIAKGLAYLDVLGETRRRNNLYCTPPLGDGEIQHIVSTLFQTHFNNHASSPTAPVFKPATYVPPAPPAKGPQEEEDPMEGLRCVTQDATDSVPWPEEALHPGGLLEDLMDYIEASAVRTERIYAFAGALVILAALAGQRVRGETNLITNFYCVVVGSSASGKDAPKRAVINILDAIHPGLYAGSDVSSDAAIVSRLASPTGHRACFVFDEIGMLLKSFKQPRGFRQNVVKLLMELTSVYRNRYSKAFADTGRNQSIPWQSLSLLGLSVPEEFFEALQDGETTNGWLARMLVFEERNPPRKKRYGPTAQPSEDLLNRLRAIWEIDAGDRVYEEKDSGGKNLQRETPADPKLLVMSKEAWTFHETMDGEADNLGFKVGEDGDKAAASLWHRAGEHALRLSMIHALSEWGPGALERGVSVEDMAWAWTIVNVHHRRLCSRAKNAIAESDFAALKQKVREIILRYVHKESQKIKSGHHPKQGAPYSHIAKMCPGVQPRMLQDAINSMITSKQLVPLAHAPEGSKRPLQLLCLVEEDPSWGNGTNSINSTLKRHSEREGEGEAPPSAENSLNSTNSTNSPLEKRFHGYETF